MIPLYAIASILINPDMTKTESLAAIQRRCQRRATAARLATNHTHSAGRSVLPSATDAAEPGTPSAVPYPSAVPQPSNFSDSCVQHSIPVLNSRCLPTLHPSPTVICQCLPATANVANDVVAAPVTVTAPHHVVNTLPVAAELTGPQPVVDLHVPMGVAVSFDDVPANSHYSAIN